MPWQPCALRFWLVALSARANLLIHTCRNITPQAVGHGEMVSASRQCHELSRTAAKRLVGIPTWKQTEPLHVFRTINQRQQAWLILLILVLADPIRSINCTTWSSSTRIDLHCCDRMRKESGDVRIGGQGRADGQKVKAEETQSASFSCLLHRSVMERADPCRIAVYPSCLRHGKHWVGIPEVPLKQPVRMIWQSKGIVGLRRFE